MANYNKVILAGNLTRDPQLSYLPNQTPAVDFGLAVNRRWRDQQGQQREDTCFIDCRAFGKPAEIINQYMRKGRSILVDGRLHYATWEKDGQKHSKHRVVVENFQFLDSGGGQGGGYQRNSAPPQARQAPPAHQAPAPVEDAGEPAPPDYDQGGGGDEIPF
ncbi:MAG: Single-stranded DNA-binding protein [Planctomycetes bacterium ADurb.Bin126]|nr:MAG: Single-stranded DNA-binding protein [Planctomycetes bacterium ADurb.Bin126]HOD83018.1 single-stranded DNA-binding protein [Phycisphaerae bacterium]HQL71550.1 single-stranded DNA-binding protein [Phycisphaerae bacterium]